MAEGPTEVTVALAGQPNVGKSTVFNMLTGLNQHVGNWPGKTIEQKTGHFSYDSLRIRLVDLPGTYSLSAHSDEERIARDFILRERPDAVVVIVNAAALERGLYLVAELMALPAPVVVGLNMLDIAEQQGSRIDVAVLEAALGVPVIALVATKNRGVRDLVGAVTRLLAEPRAARPKAPELAPAHRPQLERLASLIAGKAPPHYPEDWVALKLLEGDTEIARLVEASTPETWPEIEQVLMAHEDACLDIASSRYRWVRRMIRAAVVSARPGAITRTDRFDRIAVHHVWGPLLLLLLLGVVFVVTYTAAGPVVQWLDDLVAGPLTSGAADLLAGAPDWLAGLVVDGVVAGVGTVLTFIPVLVLFFAALAFLEDVGYLARAAYVMDPFMHHMGLHGKSVLPLIVGFGCNVPAVTGTRIIEDRRSRLLTILLAPLIPCSARLAVLAFLAPAFFGAAAAAASLGLVTANLLILFVVGVVIDHGVFHGSRSPFIMELPLYHRPNLRTIALFVWQRTAEFVRKAGSIIVVVSMLVWVLSNVPGKDVEQSLLAGLGRLLAPLGALVGLSDWRLVVALLSSFVAKENTIATLGILYPPDGTGVGLADRVSTVLTPAAAVAFLVVQMTFLPCAAVVAVTRQETRSWRWTLAGTGLMLVIALVAGTLVYQIGARL